MCTTAPPFPGAHSLTHGPAGVRRGLRRQRGRAARGRPCRCILPPCCRLSLELGTGRRGAAPSTLSGDDVRPRAAVIPVAPKRG